MEMHPFTPGLHLAWGEEKLPLDQGIFDILSYLPSEQWSKDEYTFDML